LRDISKYLSDNDVHNTLINLHDYLPDNYSKNYDSLEASILVIHGGIHIFTDPDLLLKELKDLPYDRKK
jgi:hypothetical protein